jgi:hypothetical protein
MHVHKAISVHTLYKVYRTAGDSGGEKPTLRSEDHKAQKKATEKKN